MESVMPIGRVVGAYFAEAKFETLRMLRAPAFAIPFLLIPLALYLFFGVLMAGAGSETNPTRNPNAMYYIFTGFTVVGVMGPGLFGFGISIALEREQGLLRLKRALPMPPMAYLLAKMCMAMLFSALVSTAIAVAALLTSPMSLTPTQWLSVILIGVIGTLPFCAVGLFVGARVGGRAAPAFVNLVYLPMIYLSGLFFPLPESIRVIALFSPAFHLNQLALTVAGIPSVLGASGPAMHVAALLGVTVLFTGLTIQRLSRQG